VKNDFMKELLLRHKLAMAPESSAPPDYHHQMVVYLGCADRRLKPEEHLKFQPGEAFYLRNPGALVHPQDENIEVMVEALLESPPHDKLKHLIISVHTDCLILKACRDGCGDKISRRRYVKKHLNNVHHEVMKEAKTKGWGNDPAKVLKELEKKSLLQSLANLETLPVVQKAIVEGNLKIHGWLLDTHTRNIYAMNPDTQEFELWVII